ncbi:hypothetical protein H0E87_022493 [Populus deltoides]|uniref:Uncharacterized protein n=1 Tax=Populus deltoides TaxID=3696 RepID=A0A8T2XB34_POPDE|nr:hypothetical protein H0E87_022493 [Populus deltoides]
MTTSFSMGISYLLHSHFPSSTSSSSSSSSSSQPLSFHVKKKSNNNEMTGRRRVVSACMGQEDPKDIVFSKKRAVLFLGISVLPFLQLRARALEGLVTMDNKWFDASVLYAAWSSYFLNGWSFAQLREASRYATYTFPWARSDLERKGLKAKLRKAGK